MRVCVLSASVQLKKVLCFKASFNLIYLLCPMSNFLSSNFKSPIFTRNKDKHAQGCVVVSSMLSCATAALKSLWFVDCCCFACYDYNCLTSTFLSELLCQTFFFFLCCRHREPGGNRKQVESVRASSHMSLRPVEPVKVCDIHSLKTLNLRFICEVTAVKT